MIGLQFSRRSLCFALLFCLGDPALVAVQAQADTKPAPVVIQGEVVEVQGSKVRVALQGKQLPRAGDPAKIVYEIPGTDIKASAGKGTVSSIETGSVAITVTEKTSEIRKGYLVEITSVRQVSPLTETVRDLSGQWEVATEGQGKSLWSLKRQQDGRYRAEGVIVIQAARNGNPIQVKEVRSLAADMEITLRPDQKVLFSGGGNGFNNAIKSWDLTSGKEIGSFAPATHVHKLAVSPDGRRLCAVHGEAVKVWDPDSGKQLASMAQGLGTANCLAVSPDGKRLFTGMQGKEIIVWDLETGKETRALKGHTGGVATLAVSVDGKRLYSGADTTGAGAGEINVWDLQTYALLFTLPGDRSHGTLSLAISPDGNRLVAGSYLTIKVWDLQSRKVIRTLHGHKDYVFALVISSDGKRLFSGSDDNTIKVWDLDARAEKQALNTGGKPEKEAAERRTAHLELGVVKQTLNTKGGVRGLVLSRDGTRLYSGTLEGVVTVWSVESAAAKRQNVAGTATISGATVKIEWKTDAGAEGISEWTLDPRGTGGRAKTIIRQGTVTGTFEGPVRRLQPSPSGAGSVQRLPLDVSRLQPTSSIVPENTTGELPQGHSQPGRVTPAPGLEPSGRKP